MARFTADEILRATGARAVPAERPVGEACVRVCTDTRQLAAGDLFVALRGERFDAHDFLEKAADLGAFGAVVERGRGAAVAGRLALFEVEDTLAALGDLAAFHRRRFEGLKIVAVTGSNGKTTTKELTAAALTAALGPGLKTEGNLNNLVGVPLTLLRLTGEEAWAVVEMGMNAPGEIARLTELARPDVGVVTNAGPVHLEGLGTVDGVADAKAELYAGLEDGAAAVVNLDDPRLPARAAAAGAGTRLRRIGFGAGEAADLRLGDVVLDGDAGLAFEATLSDAFGGGRLPVRLPLLGAHNALNACAALAAAAALGADLPRAAAGLAEVQGVGRRLRRAVGPQGALVLDDCYNANLLSMEVAIQTAERLALARGGRLIAALGDMLELGAHEAEMHRHLGEMAAASGVARLVAFGPRSAEAARAARGARGEGDWLLHTDDPAAAATFLADGLAREDVVLVKGSRGMAMERIVERLERLGAEGGRA